MPSATTLESFALDLEETQEGTETLAKDFAKLAGDAYELAPVSADSYELLGAARDYLSALAQILALMASRHRLELPRIEVPRE